jgi:hypothetical protein
MKTALWTLALACPSSLLPAVGAQEGAPPVAEYGDAPDGASACEGGALVTPALYPTLFASGSAVPGRTGPYHLPLPDPNADYMLGLAATTETAPEQPTCDWLTPPCDEDNGALVLCLDPPCNTGVFAAPVGCGIVASTFGFTPTPVGYWIYEVSRGPFSAQPGFVNVAVDWNLSGSYSDIPGEWVVMDEPVAAVPWQTQAFVTSAFPVPTVFPCGNPLGWCIDPLWTRFHLSDEAMLATFDGVSTFWDGSGRLAGYAGGETEDVVPTTDPQLTFTSLPRDCGRAQGTVVLTLNPLNLSCAGSQAVPLASRGMTSMRRFAPERFQTGVDVPIELLSLELVGVTPGLGMVLVHESDTRLSLGKLDAVQAGPNGELIAARSFFDVFVEVELPNLGITLDTGSRPVRVDGGLVLALPPIGSPYQPLPGALPLPLFLAGTQNHVGWLCHADFQWAAETTCPAPPRRR